MGSLDLTDYQVGNKKFPNCQVGRGKEVRLFESLRDSGVSSSQQGVLISEDSFGFADHVNEDDDKLKTCTIQKEDQKSIMMIGGIWVFLPDSPVEARACVVDATTEEGQPTKNVIEEEIEHTLTFSQGAEDEHSTEMLKIFIREDEKEMTATLKLAEEEEVDKTYFVDLCE
jgi:hypothetical protein